MKMESAKLKKILSVVAGIALIVIVVLYYTGVIGGGQDAAPQDGGTQQTVDTAQGSQSGDNSQQSTGDQQSADTQQSPDPQDGNEDNADNTSPDPDYISYHFRSDKLLTQHYEKHGIEMGFDSKESYEKAASDVINNPAALHKREAEDNDYVYYVEETNEFAVLSTDGYIRTYFLPSAGKAYYDRQ